MKTATVRELRNHYTQLLKWLKAGEEIAISQRGKVIGWLVPRSLHSKIKIDWRKSGKKRDRSFLFLHVRRFAWTIETLLCLCF